MNLVEQNSSYPRSRTVLGLNGEKNKISWSWSLEVNISRKGDEVREQTLSLEF
jgi:hypothetical protein